MVIKNKKTGVESEVTKEQWETMKSNPLYHRVFDVVPSKEDLKPKEVKALEEKTGKEKPTENTTK